MVVYDFSVDFDAISVDDILDIHNYLTKKNNMIQKNVCCNNIIFLWNCIEFFAKCSSAKHFVNFNDFFLQ